MTWEKFAETVTAALHDAGVAEAMPRGGQVDLAPFRTAEAAPELVQAA